MCQETKIKPKTFRHFPPPCQAQLQTPLFPHYSYHRLHLVSSAQQFPSAAFPYHLFSVLQYDSFRDISHFRCVPTLQWRPPPSLAPLFLLMFLTIFLLPPWVFLNVLSEVPPAFLVGLWWIHFGDIWINTRVTI